MALRAGVGVISRCIQQYGTDHSFGKYVIVGVRSAMKRERILLQTPFYRLVSIRVYIHDETKLIFESEDKDRYAVDLFDTAENNAKKLVAFMRGVSDRVNMERQLWKRRRIDLIKKLRVTDDTTILKEGLSRRNWDMYLGGDKYFLDGKIVDVA